MGRFENRLNKRLNDPKFRAGYDEAMREANERCIVFNWHGTAPTQAAGDTFTDEALATLIAIAEKHGCLIGGGFKVLVECDDCAALEACPLGRACVTCNPQKTTGAVVHMTLTGTSGPILDSHD